MRLRDANTGDAAAIRAIYAPIVDDTVISFEEVAPDLAKIASRIEAIQTAYPYLVAEDAAGEMLGYAYARQHRTRAAYRPSVDVAIYVASNAWRRGVARALYSELLRATAAQGYHAAFAGITLPNLASVGLHEAMGFRPVGVYHEVGRKFGRWLDVGWWQRLL